MSENEAIIPESCNSMAEVRQGVDLLDAALIEMLATRFGYMRAAARIKSDRGAVRDEPRKAQVIENAAAQAEKLGVPRDAISEMWEILVESSIEYELKQWDENRS